MPCPALPCSSDALPFNLLSGLPSFGGGIGGSAGAGGAHFSGFSRWVLAGGLAGGLAGRLCALLLSTQPLALCARPGAAPHPRTAFKPPYALPLPCPRWNEDVLEQAQQAKAQASRQDAHAVRRAVQAAEQELAERRQQLDSCRNGASRRDANKAITLAQRKVEGRAVQAKKLKGVQAAAGLPGAWWSEPLAECSPQQQPPQQQPQRQLEEEPLSNPPKRRRLLQEVCPRLAMLGRQREGGWVGWSLLGAGCLAAGAGRTGAGCMPSSPPCGHACPTVPLACGSACSSPTPTPAPAPAARARMRMGRSRCAAAAAAGAAPGVVLPHARQGRGQGGWAGRVTLMEWAANSVACTPKIVCCVPSLATLGVHVTPPSCAAACTPSPPGLPTNLTVCLPTRLPALPCPACPAGRRGGGQQWQRRGVGSRRRGAPSLPLPLPLAARACSGAPARLPRPNPPTRPTCSTCPPCCHPLTCCRQTLMRRMRRTRATRGQPPAVQVGSGRCAAAPCCTCFELAADSLCRSMCCLHCCAHTKQLGCAPRPTLPPPPACPSGRGKQANANTARLERDCPVCAGLASNASPAAASELGARAREAAIAAVQDLPPGSSEQEMYAAGMRAIDKVVATAASLADPDSFRVRRVGMCQYGCLQSRLPHADIRQAAAAPMYVDCGSRRRRLLCWSGALLTCTLRLCHARPPCPCLACSPPTARTPPSPPTPLRSTRVSRKAA